MKQPTKKPTKTVGVYIVQQNFGQGWETTGGSAPEAKAAEGSLRPHRDAYLEAREDVRDYRKNQPEFPVRMFFRRITRARFESGNY